MQTGVANNHSQTMPPEPSHPELSHVVRLDDISPTANTIVIEASVRECMMLAARFDLSYLRSLSAEVTYRRARGGMAVRVDGRITATYGQICGMTLSSMPMSMEESFQTEYTLAPWEKYSEFDLDQPEILTDDFIDMGEVAAQYFGLAIDPFVRRGGSELLPELAEYLSNTLQELAAINLASNASDQMPVPITAPLQFLDAQPEAIVELQPIAESDEPSSSETTDAVSTERSRDPNGTPYESLFMKYLRRIRSA